MIFQGRIAQLETLFLALLDRRLGQRPYRRIAVGEPGCGTSPLLTLGIEQSENPEGGDPQLSHWRCRVTLAAPEALERLALEAALEVIDILHGSDIDSEDIVLIDIQFIGATMIRGGEAGSERAVALEFQLQTVDNDDLPAAIDEAGLICTVG